MNDKERQLDFSEYGPPLLLLQMSGSTTTIDLDQDLMDLRLQKCTLT